MMKTDPKYGQLLAKRYQIIELVGTGAMGRVYLAHDTRLGGVTVAVKFLAQTMLSQKMRQRFFREAEICAKLGEKSIHIVRVRDYGVDEYDVPFYVMEFLKGQSLSEAIKSQPFTLARFVSLVRHICLGLQAAHDGIVYQGQLSSIIHRDIKPSNILVTQDPTFGELVKILDFGIAKLIQSDGSQTHSFMGTLAYCSPEQMEGKELDNRSDIYSLGVMAYEMLTGNMPIFPEHNSFGGWFKAHHDQPPKPISGNIALPDALQNLIMGCLAKKPDERPQSVTEILTILESLNGINGTSLPLDKYHQASKNSKADPPSSIEEICLQNSWPPDKPLQKIVFPSILSTSEGVLGTLWVMLSQADIKKHRQSIRYNHFLCLMSPHPMLLWVTALHSREYGPSWLPCYLDLKTKLGQQVTRLLSKSGSYRLLFFALEEPRQCTSVIKLSIDPTQCQMLAKWSSEAIAFKSVESPKTSKKILKQELDKIKPKIKARLDKLKSYESTHVRS